MYDIEPSILKFSSSDRCLEFRVEFVKLSIRNETWNIVGGRKLGEKFERKRKGSSFDIYLWFSMLRERFMFSRYVLNNVNIVFSFFCTAQLHFPPLETGIGSCEKRTRLDSWRGSLGEMHVYIQTYVHLHTCIRMIRYVDLCVQVVVDVCVFVCAWVSVCACIYSELCHIGRWYVLSNDE